MGHWDVSVKPTVPIKTGRMASLIIIVNKTICELLLILFKL